MNLSIFLEALAKAFKSKTVLLAIALSITTLATTYIPLFDLPVWAEVLALQVFAVAAVVIRFFTVGPLEDK